ncbi:hypothetical protein AKJ16_DCAP09118 [Drosera capensis]
MSTLRNDAILQSFPLYWQLFSLNSLIYLMVVAVFHELHRHQRSNEDVLRLASQNQSSCTVPKGQEEGCAAQFSWFLLVLLYSRDLDDTITALEFNSSATKLDKIISYKSSCFVGIDRQSRFYRCSLGFRCSSVAQNT